MPNSKMLSLFIIFLLVVDVVVLTVVDLDNYLQEKRIHGISNTGLFPPTSR